MYLYSVGTALSNLCTYRRMTEGPILIDFFSSFFLDMTFFMIVQNTLVKNSKKFEFPNPFDGYSESLLRA